MGIFVYLGKEKQYFHSSLVQVCTSTTEQFSFGTGSPKAEFQFEHCCMKEQTGDSRLASSSSVQADTAGRIYYWPLSASSKKKKKPLKKNQGKDLLSLWAQSSVTLSSEEILGTKSCSQCEELTCPFTPLSCGGLILGFSQLILTP